MLSFLYKNGSLTQVSDDLIDGGLTRHDIQNLAHADEIAADATALTGRLHVGVDKGDHTWPRFDVVEAPRVGEPVSKGFNGDYYPCGTIVKVSESLRVVTTDNGTTFYRRGKTATWLNNRTWALVHGHKSERNPHF